MILRPDKSCCFSNDLFLIDLGPGGTDITKCIEPDDTVNLVLTHHDADHMGGFKFLVGKMQQLQQIIVPFHQNEITLIAKSILHLKGIYAAVDCDELIRLLEEIVGNQMLLKSLFGGTSLSKSANRQTILSFAYDKKQYCGHLTCLNPPIYIDTYDWLREMPEDDLTGVFHELFTAEHADVLTQYAYAARRGRRWRYADSQELYSLFLENDEFDLNSNETGDLSRNLGNFVIGFIMENLALFREFNRHPVRGTLKKIYRNYTACAHDVCIVLQANYGGQTFLLTGDASKKVFYRLIGEGRDLKADYLKVPHHGSKENLNKQILDAIKPRVAIISHNNRRFGKAKDPHPNLKVLTLLQKKQVKILLTNDVLKNGAVYMQKALHKDDVNVEIL